MDIVIIRDSLVRHRRFYLIEGAAFILLGLLSIFIPMATAIAINVIVAIALIIGGVGRLMTWSRQPHDRHWKLGGGILLLVIGIVMLVFPNQGISALVLVIGGLLVLEAALSFSLAAALKGFPGRSWWFASGSISLVLGVLVLLVFPEVGVFYIGLMIGLCLVMYGLATLITAWNVNDFPA